MKVCLISSSISLLVSFSDIANINFSKDRPEKISMPSSKLITSLVMRCYIFKYTVCKNISTIFFCNVLDIFSKQHFNINCIPVIIRKLTFYLATLQFGACISKATHYESKLFVNLYKMNLTNLTVILISLCLNCIIIP